MRAAIVLLLCVIHAVGSSSIEFGIGRKLLQEFEVSTSDGIAFLREQFKQGAPTVPPSDAETDQNQSVTTDTSQSVPETTTEASGSQDTQDGEGGGENEFVENMPEQNEGVVDGSQTVENSQQGEVATGTETPTDDQSVEVNADQSDVAQMNQGSEEGSPENGAPDFTTPSDQTTTSEDSNTGDTMDSQGGSNINDVQVPVSEPGIQTEGSDNDQPSSQAIDTSETVTTQEEQEGLQEGASGCSPFDLWNAVENGEVDKVKSIVASCPDMLENESELKVDGNQRGTVLHSAVVFANLEILKVLLDAGSNVNAVTNGGWTPLHLAAAFDLPEIARELLHRGADKNALDSFQQIPLHDASSGGSIELVQILVNWGSNVNQANVHGETPLINAAIRNSPEIIKILLEGGADINQKDNEGQTALIEAAIYGSENAVRVLLENGANKDITDNEGRTASFSACYCENYSGSEEYIPCDQSGCGDEVKGRVITALSK